MNRKRKSRPLARRKLTAALAAVMGLAVFDAAAANITVFNCNDAGPGSLRAAVAAAASASVVDMSGLTTQSVGCGQSVITLTTGAISVMQSDLSILGPAGSAIAIDASSRNQRALIHYGTGNLKISYLQIENGNATPPASGLPSMGGCIYSSGSVELDTVSVKGCVTSATSSHARGGAIYAVNGISLSNSSVTASMASSIGMRGMANAIGGAIASPGFITLRGSNISGNSSNAGGGGVWTYRGPLNVYSSLVSNNYAGSYGGGLVATGTTGFTLVNSTIAENSTPGSSAGVSILSNGATAFSIANSTIAFNAQGSTNRSAGLYINQFRSSITLSINSTLVSNNTAAGAPNDTLFLTDQMTGAKNLVFAPVNTVPSDTIIGACPRLARLRNNGGSNDTVSLQSGSVALDAGNNVFAIPLLTDQRLAGYPRVSGSAADIGSYELQQSDIVFASNIEGCP